MARIMAALLAMALFAGLCAAQARDAAPLADDTAMEARVMHIAAELRCLVCQNQTIADSHADLAIDLRKQIREKLAAGMSERQILEFMSDRYGDFVLYRPPVKATTVLLWAGPFVLLLVGGLALVRIVRARRREAGPAPLSDADLARARALLGPDPSTRPVESSGTRGIAGS